MVIKNSCITHIFAFYRDLEGGVKMAEVEEVVLPPPQDGQGDQDGQDDREVEAGQMRVIHISRPKIIQQYSKIDSYA